jgi:hypothetical protein
MEGTSWRVSALASLLVVVLLCGLRAEDAKPTDEGNAATFKGKTFELKDKGEAAILLSFTAGAKVQVTVKSDERTDVNLFVYDSANKVVAKDDSEGPDCEVKFTVKEAGKYKLVVQNHGPGKNRSTLKVKLEK